MSELKEDLKGNNKKVKEYLYATRIREESFIHETSKDDCPFCKNGKIIEGIFLHFSNTGHPCCENCYKKAEGFNEWYESCRNIGLVTDEPLREFVPLFCQDLHPYDAVKKLFEG